MTHTQFKDEVVPHYKPMYVTAMALLNDSADAADAVQDAMVQLWNHRSSLDGVNNLKAYCCGSVRNICLTRLRQRTFPVSLDESATNIADSTDPASEIEHREDLSMITKAIGQLSENQQTVLRMSSFGGCSNTEIARATGLSETNIRALLSRSRKKLRTLFS